MTQQKIACENTMSQDIIFLLDESDNMDDTEFDSVKTFVSNILDYASPSSTRVGLATFTTSATEVLSLNDNTDASTAKSSVSSLTRTGSSSMNAKTTVTWAKDEFESYSTSGERRVLVIVIAGISTDAFCTKSLHLNEYNIDTYIIAVGSGWQKRAYRCAAKSNNNYEGLIAIDDPTNLPGSSQQETAELLICPHHPLVTVTEVQPSGVCVCCFLFLFLFFRCLFDDCKNCKQNDCEFANVFAFPPFFCVFGFFWLFWLLFVFVCLYVCKS